MAYLALAHAFDLGGPASERANAERALADLPRDDRAEPQTTYPLGPELPLHLFMSQLNLAAIESLPTHLRLHAAALQHPASGRVVALLGPSGAGKSTLTTTLLRTTELRYLSDEVTPVDVESLGVTPYPKPLTLKVGSHPVFPDLAPGDDEPLWQVPATVIRPGCVGTGGTLAMIVTPRHEVGAALSTTRLSPAEVVLAMAQQSSYLLHFDRPLATLADVARRVRGVAMTYGDARDAAAAVSDLVERG